MRIVVVVLGVPLMRIVVVVLGMLLMRIVVVVLGVVLMLIVVVVLRVVLVLFPGAAFPRLEQFDPRRLGQFHERGLAGQRLQGLGQKGLNPLPDPEHHVGLVEAARLRRAQGVGMGRTAAADQQARLSDPLHHGRDQAVHRLNARHHLRRRIRWGARQGGNEHRGRATRAERSGPAPPCDGPVDTRHRPNLPLALLRCYNISLSAMDSLSIPTGIP